VIEAAADFLGGPVPAAAPVATRPRNGHVGQPRILLAATLRWPLAARLAIAFNKLGCEVQAWCPRGHPLEKTHAVARIHAGSALAPLRSLRAAIRLAVPDFVIPCDDDAAIHLNRLHERNGDIALRALIERSLGVPASCSFATTRGQLMLLALAAGVRVPETRQIGSSTELDAWCAQHRFPAVLKLDRSWGGLGVTVVRDRAQARKAWRRALHPSPLRALSHLVLRRDPSYLLRWLNRARPGITLQAFVDGRPANRAVACWRGEVLAGISVVALQTQTPNGPATVVRVVDHPEMAEAARRLVRALGLSGLCGLDFVVEPATGAAWLIEVNPRATPISHLPLGSGRDLPAALHACLRDEPAPASACAIRGDGIAMFPGEWCRDPLSPHLRSAFHDVPWAEIDLVRDCVDLPWDERGLVARLRARLAPGRAPRPAELPLPQIGLAGSVPPER